MLAAADYRTYGRCKEVRKRRLMGMEKRDGTINWMPQNSEWQKKFNVNNLEADLQNKGGCGQRITKLELF